MTFIAVYVDVCFTNSFQNILIIYNIICFRKKKHVPRIVEVRDIIIYCVLMARLSLSSKQDTA
jgi:hypothetical protein